MGQLADTSDAELLARSRGGDRVAFGAIVERYQRAVGAVSYSGTRDRALGEDVTQDTFVTAWRQLGALRDADRLPAWLCGIARNLARSAKRRRGRETALDDRDPATDAASPFEAISERETEAAVAAALASVPDTYREPLVLFYGEDRSVKDVARALAISEQAVHQRLSRGRQCLAADVAGLVEISLERRRPRAGLAAAVGAAIAGIAIATTTSRVEAATRHGGSSMLKIAAATALVAALAGTGYVVERSSADTGSAQDRVTPTATTAAREVAASATTPNSRASRAASFVVPGASATATAGAAGPDGPHLPAVIDCTVAAGRFAELSFETQPDAMTMDAHMRADFDARVRGHYERECATEKWSSDFMTCVVAADNMFTAGAVCGQYRSEPPAREAHPDGKLDGEVVLADATTSTPPASLDDLGCGAVAKHVAALMRPDQGQIDKLPPDRRASVMKGIERAMTTVPDEVEASCTQASWPEDVRRCLLLGTSSSATGTCTIALGKKPL